MKMHKHVRQIITFAAALAVSSLAVSMAIASAMQRATTDHDRVLLASLSVVIVMAVHLLPALLRGRQRLVMWSVWSLCLGLAAYGHASWFYLSSESAAEVRHAGSSAALAVAAERAAIEQALAGIKARPVATVAAQLARTTDTERREALALELAEARRAAGLRDRLVAVAGTVPGTPQVRPGTPGYGPGTPEEQSGTRPRTGVQLDMTMVMSVVAAVVIELLGALLWAAALRGDDDAAGVAKPVHTPSPTVFQQVVNVMAPIMSRSAQAAGVVVADEAVDELADLRSAIAQGRCRPSARGIKEYMSCGSDTAARLRRQLTER